MTDSMLVRKADEAVKSWAVIVGDKKANKMLANVLGNCIKYYDADKDGEKIVRHLLEKVIEVMGR